MFCSQTEKGAEGESDKKVVEAASIDWQFAWHELMEKQGLDLRKEMDTRIVQLEEQHRREKELAEREFALKEQELEYRIQCLQDQVEFTQSIMSASVSATLDELVRSTYDESDFSMLEDQREIEFPRKSSSAFRSNFPLQSKTETRNKRAQNVNFNN